MRKIGIIYGKVLLLTGVLLLLLSCQSTPSSASSAQEQNSRRVAVTQARMNELERQIERGNIFEGTVQARTPTIGIIRPSNPPAGRLSQDELWYLDMIRSAMNSNFTRFATGRIQVVNLSDDVVNSRNEEIMRSLSGSNDELSVVMRTAARAIMTGEIIKQPNNRFHLSFTITETETGRQLAAYSHTYSDIELIEGIAINRATDELLKQLNVTLNEAGRHALFRTSNASDIALARGLNAVNTGQGLQAMNYLFNAASFNNTASQANTTLVAVQSRNQAELAGAGSQVMDFFKRHEIWQGRLNEFNDFYTTHAPFELFYTPPTPSNMIVSGNLRTYDLNFNIGLRWNQNQIEVMERVLQEYILDGLNTNSPEDIQRWDLKGLPDDSNLFNGPNNFIFNLVINVENERGTVITSGTFTLYGSLFRYRGKIYARCTQQVNTSFVRIVYVEEHITPNLYIRVVSINGVNIQTVGETGFMRVVQTQDNILPAVQPDSLPQRLASRLQGEVAATKRGRTRTRKELENHKLRERRMYFDVNGGTVLGTDTGSLNVSFGSGAGFLEFQCIYQDYFGYEKYIQHSDISYKPPVRSLGLGFSSVHFGRTWLFKITPGFIYLFLNMKEPRINNEGEEENYDSALGGSIQTTFDWNPFAPNRNGILYLRLGYRLNFFPKKIAPIFGKNEENMINTFITNTIFVGLVFYFLY